MRLSMVCYKKAIKPGRFTGGNEFWGALGGHHSGGSRMKPVTVSDDHPATLKLAILTEVGFFGWDQMVKDSLAVSIKNPGKQPAVFNCTAVMENELLYQRFTGWKTESSGEFRQDPEPGVSPIQVGIYDETWNFTASKKKFITHAEGILEKHMLCAAMPVLATRRNSFECCVTKSLVGLGHAHTALANATARARLLNF